MNLRHGFKRITFVLAIATSIFCAFLSLETVRSEYAYARSDLERAKESVQGWEDTRISEPLFYNQNVDSVISCQRKLIEAKENDWLKLSTEKFVGLCIVSALGGAIVGYLGTWVVIWFGGIVIYKFIMWLVSGFREDKGFSKTAEQIAERHNKHGVTLTDPKTGKDLLAGMTDEQREKFRQFKIKNR